MEKCVYSFFFLFFFKQLSNFDYDDYTGMDLKKTKIQNLKWSKLLNLVYASFQGKNRKCANFWKKKSGSFFFNFVELQF